MEQLKILSCRLAGLSVYRSLRDDPVLRAFDALAEQLRTPAPEPSGLADGYAAFCTALYESKFHGNLPDYVYNKVLLSENYFTAEAARGNFDSLPTCIREAAARDLNALYDFSRLSADELKAAIASAAPEGAALSKLLPDYMHEPYHYKEIGPWGDSIAHIAEYHRHNGVGVFSQEIAFRFDGERILPVKGTDPIRLSDLKHYEAQRDKIVENTLSFLHGKPCNNILLYGDRGTGKSSTVKALLNEYYGIGLRIVQVEKKHLNNLAMLIELLADNPLKFIIFIDDLTFNENDDGFGALKAVLEGSLSRKADNTVIYATSNRRHLIKETFSSREGDEVHRADTIDDSLSLSDRFGLTITFMVPDKAKFLDIVLKIAQDRGLQADEDVLIRGAERFALQKAGRSPRIARQYIDMVQGRLEMGLPLQ